MGIRSSANSRGASKAGTATRQKAFAATSSANCSAADSAASLAASASWPVRSFLDGGALNPEQQYCHERKSAINAGEDERLSRATQENRSEGNPDLTD
jgi:hypothetical protein